MNNYNDKIVVITGGAGGTGYAIAENFLQKCVTKVILVDINEKLGVCAEDNFKTKYGNERVIFLKGDVTTDLDILYKKIIESQKTVDILVNCAGVGERILVENTININLTAVIKWSLKFHEYMRVNKSGLGGTIINISSILGYRNLPYAPVYQASKFGVLGFGKSLGHSHNFNKFGVRVITLCPGFTETNLINTTKIHFDGFTHNDFLSGLMDYLKNVTFLQAHIIGQATVDIFETAESGTVWEIANSSSHVQIP